MSRSRSPLVDISGLEDLRADFDLLGKYVFADVLQDIMNRLAEVGQERMQGAFERGIEGGPSRFSRVVPGSMSSSVLVRRHKGATGGIASAEIEVQDKQSAYLKYMLGEASDRPAGDVGVASKRNFIPNAAGLRAVGLQMTPEGGLPRNALRRLNALVQRGKVGHGLRKSKSLSDFDAENADRAAGRGTGETVFFGTPRGKRKGKGAEGFWLRPASKGGAKKGGLLAIASAAKVSRYDEDYLTPYWNEAVEHAAGDVDRIARVMMERALDVLQARRGASDRRRAMTPDQRKASNLKALRGQG